MLAKDIKRGSVVHYSDAPCIIESVTVHTPSARGAATIYKFRGRNLITRQKVDITLRGGESLGEADFQRRPIKLMYADGAEMHFLDQIDFNQYSLPLESLSEEKNYLTEELEGVLALIHNDRCIGIQMPAAVALKIAQCDPAVRGNSATSRSKAATLETGLVIQVPEYLAEGTIVKVDTRSGEFLSRA